VFQLGSFGQWRHDNGGFDISRRVVDEQAVDHCRDLDHHRPESGEAA
jgi:hypothetical protein